MSKTNKLVEMKKVVISKLPLENMVRGTFIERYLECSRKNCNCHRAKKYRHGPYYFITIRKKNKSNHVYVPLKHMKEIKNWVENYNKVWAGIEKITDINIQIIREMSKEGRKTAK